MLQFDQNCTTTAHVITIKLFFICIVIMISLFKTFKIIISSLTTFHYYVYYNIISVCGGRSNSQVIDIQLGCIHGKTSLDNVLYIIVAIQIDLFLLLHTKHMLGKRQNVMKSASCLIIHFFIANLYEHQ